MNPRRQKRSGFLFDIDYPAATQPRLPLVEICGDKRVLIENHRGVCSYSACRIVVNGSNGQICVCGKELNIAHMTKYQLVIYGCIESVSMLKGER